MSSQAAQEAYLKRLAESVHKDHGIHRVLSDHSLGRPRVYLSTLDTVGDLSPSQVMHQTRKDSEAGQLSVCVVEDIDREWIAVLGPEWKIGPYFFAEHVANTTGEDLWESVTGPHVQTGYRHESKHELMHHIEGVVPHLMRESIASRVQRWLQYDRYYGWQVNTRISYVRVSRYLCEEPRAHVHLVQPS
jgi:hypothetical protein